MSLNAKLHFALRMLFLLPQDLADLRMAVSEANQTEELRHAWTDERVHGLLSAVADLQQRVSSLENGSQHSVSSVTPHHHHRGPWSATDLCVSHVILHLLYSQRAPVKVRRPKPQKKPRPPTQHLATCKVPCAKSCSSRRASPPLRFISLRVFLLDLHRGVHTTDGASDEPTATLRNSEPLQEKR